MRALRWLLAGLVALILLVGIAVLGLTVATRIPVAERALRAQLETLLGTVLGDRAHIGRIEGSLLRTVVVHDVTLTRRGRTIARIPRLAVSWWLPALLSRRLVLERVEVTDPWARVVHTADGWQLPDLPTTKTPADASPSTFAVEIRRVAITGGRVSAALLDAAPARRAALAGLAVQGAVTVVGGRVSVVVDGLSATPRGVDVSPLHVAGRCDVGPDGITVTDAVVATARSRVAATGTVDPRRRTDVRATLAPLAAREVRALLPEVHLLADLRADATAAGPWSAIATTLGVDAGAGGRLDVDATLDAGAEPFAYRGRVTFTALDPAAVLADLPPAHATGTLQVDGFGIDAQASLRYELSLAASDLADFPITAATVQGEGTGGDHHARLAVVTSAGRAKAVADLGLHQPLTYRGRARLALDHVEALLPDAPGWVRAQLDVRGSGTDPATARGSVRAAIGGAEVRGVRVDDGHLDADLAGGRLTIAAARLTGPELHATGRGAIDFAARTADVSLDGGADLRTIGTRARLPLAGAATVQARASGPFDALAVTAGVVATQPGWDTLTARTLNVQATLAGIGGATPSGDATADATGLVVGGNPPRDAHATVGWRRREEQDAVTMRATTRDPDGRTSIVALEATRAGPRVTGRLGELVVALPEGPAWQLAAPAAFTWDERLTLDSLVLGAGAQRLTLAGTLGATGPANARLALDRIDLGPVCALVGAPPCGGRADGRVALTGTASAPLADGELRVTDASVRDRRYGDVVMHTRYADRRLTLDAAVERTLAGDLDLDGTIPIDLAWSGPRADLRDTPLALRLHAARLDLAFIEALAPHTVTRASGVLSADIRLGGTRAAPQVDGQIALAGGTFGLAATGVVYEDVTLRLRGRNDALVVETLHVRAGDGRLDGSGSIALVEFRPERLEIQLSLDRFLAVRLPAYEATASGHLRFYGTPAAPALYGDVQVVRALVRPASLPVSAPPVETDPTITVVNGPPEPPPPPPSPGAELAENLDVSLGVHVAGDAYIRRNDANLELGGDLRIEKRAGQDVRLYGQVILLRGWYAFQGRRFELDRGTITFTGESPPNPGMDVTATYTTLDYLVEVHVGGTAIKPTLDLTSQPPLEQADVLAVLLFGRPTTQLGRGESVTLQQRAAALTAGYVVPELRGSVMKAFGLDTLDVAMPQGETPGAVRVGRYVRDDVFLSLGQEFGQRAGQIVGLEYGITRSISVRVETSTRGQSSGDVYWKRRY